MVVILNTSKGDLTTPIKNEAINSELYNLCGYFIFLKDYSGLIL